MAISPYTLEVARTAAEQVTNLGIVLEPANAQFNRLLELSSTPQIKNEARSLESVDLAKETECQYANGECHGHVLDDLIQMYLRTAIGRVDTVRRQVVPFVDEVIAEVNAQYSESTYIQTEVRPVAFPEIYKSEEYLSFISRHKKVTPYQTQAVQTRGGFVTRDENEIMGLIKTGSTILDDQITTLLARYPSNWIVDTYQEFFVNGANIPVKLDAIKQIEYVDKCLLTYFILASFITNDVIDGTVDLKLEDYRNYLTTTFSEIGGLLNRFTYDIVLNYDTPNLVYHFDKNENIAYVYEHKYNQYIQDGGGVEALLGAIHQGILTHRVDLITKKAELTAWYHSFYRDQMDRIRSTFRPRIVQLFREAFPRVLAKRDAKFISLFAHLISTEIDPLRYTDQQLHEVTAKIAQNAARQSGEDIYEIFLKAIVGFGLAPWGFYDMIQTIGYHVENGKYNDPREACFHLIMDELIKHVIDGNVTIYRKG